MDRGHRLVPGVSGDLGDALDNADGGVEHRVELVFLKRRRLHGDEEGRRRDFFCWRGGEGERHAISAFETRSQPTGTHGSAVYGCGKSEYRSAASSFWCSTSTCVVYAHAKSGDRDQ